VFAGCPRGSSWKGLPSDARRARGAASQVVSYALSRRLVYPCIRRRRRTPQRPVSGPAWGPNLRCLRAPAVVSHGEQVPSSATLTPSIS
jgi:hypothetical protein